MGRRIEIDREPKKPPPEGQRVPTPPEGLSESQTSITPEAGSPYTFGQGASTTPISITEAPTTQLFTFSRKVWLFIGIGLIVLIMVIVSLFSSANKPKKAEGPRVVTPAFTKWNGFIAKGPLLALRKCPEIDCEKIGNLLVGEPVEILSQSKDWYRVKSKERGEGYIQANLVSKDKPILTLEDYLARGKFYLGAAEYQKVIEEVEQAKRLKPESSEPYMLAVRVYHVQGKKGEAIKEFTEALKRGIEGSHSIVLNIKTGYGPLKIEAKEIKSIEGGIVKLKDGSRYEGEISLETK